MKISVCVLNIEKSIENGFLDSETTKESIHSDCILELGEKMDLDVFQNKYNRGELIYSKTSIKFTVD